MTYCVYAHRTLCTHRTIIEYIQVDKCMMRIAECAILFYASCNSPSTFEGAADRRWWWWRCKGHRHGTFHVTSHHVTSHRTQKIISLQVYSEHNSQKFGLPISEMQNRINVYDPFVFFIINLSKRFYYWRCHFNADKFLKIHMLIAPNIYQNLDELLFISIGISICGS